MELVIKVIAHLVLKEVVRKISDLGVRRGFLNLEEIYKWK